MILRYSPRGEAKRKAIDEKQGRTSRMVRRIDRQ